MNSSNIKKLLAVALVAKGVYFATKKIVKANKKNGVSMENNNLKTQLSKEDSFSMIEKHSAEINSIYNEVSDFFKDKDVTADELLSMNASKKVLFNFEEESFRQHDITVSYPEEKVVKGYSKIIFKENKEDLVTEVILRISLESWEGYLDLLLYSCISKISTNKTYLQVIDSSPVILKSHNQHSIISLERISKKTESGESNFVVRNVVSGAEVKTVNYKNV
jgi:type III secretion system FlhB-like substrate exporter